MRLLPIRLAARLLLYVSAAGASCAVYRRGRLAEVRALPPGEEGWQMFNDLLLRHANVPVAVAVDTVDELYRPDPLPHARGRDRREMTERRLRQIMHHSPYRAALRQEPMGDDSRRDHYLMMGLTNPAMLAPWLDILHVRGTWLAGIWLVPALAPALARRLGLGSARLLLVSEQTGGLRLSYLEHGELRFSRLAPVDSRQHENPLESYADEIERTRQALVGQRLLARVERLRTLLLDPLNTLSDLHGLLPESSGFQCESIARARLLDTLNLPPSLLAESSDALYLRLLPDAPVGANLMTPEQGKLARARGLGHFFRRAALACAGIAALSSAGLLLDAWHLHGQSEDRLRSAEALRAQESALLREAGGSDAVHHRLRALDAWQTVSALDLSPGPLLEVAMRAVAATGDIRPRRLDWNSPRVRDGAQAVLALEGEVSPFDGDFRRAHARVEALRDRLRATLPTGHSVEVALWPLDAAPEHSLEGEFGQGRLNAPFRIEVALR
ncbi:MAG: hypothetical protein FJ209_04305 [Betaproteobacteria bacterium]|nr:hypothetical protein [Betaproteobacteria bacterium]